MRREDVIRALCPIISRAGEHMDSRKQLRKFAHDCICGNNPEASTGGPVVDEEVIDFIRAAVEDKIAKQRGGH